MKGWIGVDLDGTLAHYEHWVSELHIGPPIPAMVERVKGWLAQGLEVRILTARVSGGSLRPLRDTLAIRDAIRDWCLEHIGEDLAVTCEKDNQMVELYDDRCVQVEANTGRLIGQSTRGL